MDTQIPKGIEVLVKKASVDPAFRSVLLERRTDAAKEIGLELDAAESLMQAAVPPGQLEAIIAQTDVPQEHRRAFLGQAAAAMLAALGVLPTSVSAAQSGAAGSGIMVGGMMADDPNGNTPSGKKSADDPKEIERRIVSMVAKRFKLAEADVKPDTSFADDLQADAAQLGGLKRQLEKQFKLSIPKKDFEAIETVGDAVKCVQDAARRGKQPAQTPRRTVPPDNAPRAVGGVRPD